MICKDCGRRALVVFIDWPPLHFPGGTEKNYKSIQSLYSITFMIFETTITTHNICWLDGEILYWITNKETFN